MRFRPVIAIAAVTLVGGACTPFRLPSGAAPMRYRDAVFSDVTLTSDIPYGAGTSVVIGRSTGTPRRPCRDRGDGVHHRLQTFYRLLYIVSI